MAGRETDRWQVARALFPPCAGSARHPGRSIKVTWLVKSAAGLHGAGYDRRQRVTEEVPKIICEGSSKMK